MVVLVVDEQTPICTPFHLPWPQQIAVYRWLFDSQVYHLYFPAPKHRTRNLQCLQADFRHDKANYKLSIIYMYVGRIEEIYFNFPCKIHRQGSFCDTWGENPQNYKAYKIIQILTSLILNIPFLHKKIVDTHASYLNSVACLWFGSIIWHILLSHWDWTSVSDRK